MNARIPRAMARVYVRAEKEIMLREVAPVWSEANLLQG